MKNSLDSVKKRVVLGVTGSIAAYKACDIVRELLRRGYDIKVVMTPDSHQFISETTLAALSRSPVATHLFSSQPYGPIPHIDMAKDMDLLLVAPATAHCIARFAHGLADDLLSALFLAAQSPVILAPAMNPVMYAHPMVQANIEGLRHKGIMFIEPVEAEVACGQYGQGHLAPIEKICSEVDAILNPKQPFKDLTFLVTAGPTREFIDPVRFLSNRSSGKMGFALAHAARKKGANVILISGPTTLLPPKGVDFIPVTTAEEMFKAISKTFSNVDVVIMAAAVADFRPARKISSKIKKKEGLATIHLEATPDILSELGKKKARGQILIGFAAEDRDIVKHAKQKLNQKNLDLIVANDIARPEIGFETDTNQVTLIQRTGEIQSLPKAKKDWIAEKILDYLEGLLDQR